MAITTTTLSSAISTTSENKIALASASGISSGTMLRVDGEAMRVLGVEGKEALVRRGEAGTKAATHASGATVYIGTPAEFSLPAVQFVGKSLTGTAGATATKGYLAVIVDGTLRYIPLTDSVS